VSTSEQKRQKKLAKQKKKRKEKKAVIASQKFLSSSLKSAEQATKYPIYECYAPENISKIGMGTVLISRKISATTFAIGVFLIDSYYFGVKNAFSRIIDNQEYYERVLSLKNNEKLIKVDPSHARKLVEDSIDYAKNLGLNPHPDYAEAKYIFGNIDTRNCTTIFEFGKDGKPLLIHNPSDDLDEDNFLFGDEDDEDDEDEFDNKDDNESEKK